MSSDLAIMVMRYLRIANTSRVYRVTPSSTVWRDDAVAGKSIRIIAILKSFCTKSWYFLRIRRNKLMIALETDRAEQRERDFSRD